jgi:hypothetical protein
MGEIRHPVRGASAEGIFRELRNPRPDASFDAREAILNEYP